MKPNHMDMIFEGTEKAIEALYAGDPDQALRYLILIRRTVAWETLEHCEMSVDSALYKDVIAAIHEQETVRMAKAKP